MLKINSCEYYWVCVSCQVAAIFEKEYKVPVEFCKVGVTWN
jgi:hypothetical protein